MRFKRRQWKDKRSGFTRRAQWFDDMGTDIRITLEDANTRQHHYPPNHAVAEELWGAFKRGQIDAWGAVIEPDLEPHPCPTCNAAYRGMPPCPTCGSEIPF